MRRWRSLPVRTRLTAWYVLVLAAALLVFAAGTSITLYWQLSHQLTRFAIQDVETVEGLLFFAPDGRLLFHEDYHNHPSSKQVAERLLEVLSPSGKILYRNERLGKHTLGGIVLADEGVNGYSERTVGLENGGLVRLVSRQHVMNGQTLILRLGYSEATIWSRIEEFLTAALTSLPFLLGVAAFLGYHLARRFLLPLEEMAQRAEQITAERLDQRLPVENPKDELGHLARVINSVLDRLQLSFEQLRRFTSDASHELRTPLAAIRSVGEVGLQKSRSAADYQDTIGSMLEEVTRLTKLVENLLAISRADSNQVKVKFGVFSPLEVTREVVSLVGVLADERSQTIRIRGDDSLRVCGDRLLLRQTLINVLHNAMNYSPQGGAIGIDIEDGKEDRIRLRVSDQGPGIASEHRDKIFDRFYRVDSARTRETGGAGLGLAIARWAVEAQHGKIQLEDSAQGATFAIYLPRADRSTC